MIKTKDFPQADRLAQVAMVAEAVANNQNSDDQIERFIQLDSGGRQGRYYRLAAQILGLILNSSNQSVLTDLGAQYISISTSKEKNIFLTNCVLKNYLFRKVLSFIKNDTPTLDELKIFIVDLYPGAPGTASRRTRSVISWLETLKLIEHRQNKIYLQSNAPKQYIESKPINQGFKGSNILQVVSPPFSDAEKKIFSKFQKLKTEKALATHKKLVFSTSELLIGKGFLAQDNEFVDLYSETPGQEQKVIYEMKSITDNNFLSQVRGAVSQLFEYRYRVGVPDAKLCIVTNKPIPQVKQWIADYLENDRKISYMWTENFTNFQVSTVSKTLLGKFSP